jgi:hypothetical protein
MSDKDTREAFEAWYKANKDNYSHIAGTPSWVERAWRAYDAGARSKQDRVEELGTCNATMELCVGEHDGSKPHP